MKVGDLVLCRGKKIGIIVELKNDSMLPNLKDKPQDWARILWGNYRYTWEEIESSFVPGIIEIISES